MMDVVGYCTIKNDATSGVAQNLDKFLGKDLRVMEFDQWGGVLVISSDATELAMFDKQDVIRKFECTIMGEYIMPPKLDMIGQMAYTMRLNTRKGGYAPILKQMVIQASLMKGQFNDNFLFQKERDDNAMKEREEREKQTKQ